MTERKFLMILHAALAFLAPAIIFALVGCDNKLNGEPVEYGPEIPFEKISDAIIKGIDDIDPNQTQLGAFVHYSTKQSLAAGKVQTVLADTGLTVVKREESPEGVILTLVEKKFLYVKSGEAPQQEEREYKLDFRTPQEPPAESSALSKNHNQVENKGLVLPEHIEKLRAANFAPSSTARASFHNLKTSTFNVAAPPSVRAKPNCLNLPNCEITLHQVSFDQVTRFDNDIERIRFDFYVSPHIPQISGFNMSPVFPYYQGLFKSCVTLMVPVGDGRSKTLLAECQEVENFRYTVEPSPAQ